MSEYIGSRISLISKSDIKYVGTLHEINSDSHTVALESVTSFGTEGRKGNPAEELPGSDQVYEYIVFRGSDVKELQIIEPRNEAKENNAPPKMPNDPAILGSARPSQQQPPQPPLPPPPQQPTHQSPFNAAHGPYPQPPQQPQFGGYHGPPPPNAFPNPSRFQGPGGPHGFPGMPGAVPGYGMDFPPPPPGYYGPPPGQGFPHHPPPPNFPPHQRMPFGGPGQQTDGQRGPQQPPPAGSKQGTPQPPASGGPPPGKPTPPVQAENAVKAAPSTPAPVSSSDPPPASATVDSATVPSAPVAPAAASQPPIGPKAWSKPNPRVAVPLQPTNRAAKVPARPVDSAVPSTVPASANQPQSIADATQAATAAVAAAMAKLGSGSQAQAAHQGDNLSQKFNQMRIQDPQRARGRGRGGALRGARGDSAPKQIDVPKEDFDFESSNAKFNKESLVKEAIASGSPIASPVNGESANTGLTTNGQADGDNSTTDDVVIPTAEKGYDKKSSFFDNISSDLKDRIEQAERDASAIDGRALRREERSKNVETFGQGSVDSGGYRGGYRGRGRGGRGFGNAHRGGGGIRGNRGGYEGRGGGYRPRGARGGAEPAFA